MHKKKNQLWTGIICILACEVIYGMSYVFTKSATEIASPFALIGWRFLVALVGVSMLIAVGVMKIRMKGKAMKPLFMVALFNPLIYFITESTGISKVTASEGGVIIGCIPIACIIASTLLLKKKPTKWQVSGISLTVIGISITVAAVGMSSSLSVVGYALLITAITSYAIYSVYVEKAEAFTGTELTFMMILIGAIVFVPLALIEAGINHELLGLFALPLRESTFLVAILYQGWGSSIVAFFLTNIGIRYLGVNMASSFVGVSTIISILAGVIWLGESFSGLQILGTVVILAGVYVANAAIIKGEK